MNSDPTTPEMPSGLAPAEETAAPPARRRRSRRPAASATSSTEATPDAAAVDDAATDQTAAPTSTRRRRSGTAQSAPAPDAPASPPDAEATPGLQAILEPLDTQDALIAERSADEQAAGEAPLARGRRRRGRGGRGAPGTAEEDVPIEPGATALAGAAGDEGLPAVGVTADTTENGAVGEAATPARRRRRRGRGGRAAVEAEAEDEGPATGAAWTDVVTQPAAAVADEAGPAPLSPAVQRRFDHRDWRNRPYRAAGNRQAAARTVPEEPIRSMPLQAGPADAAAPSRTSDPVPFERPARGRRFDERHPAAQPQVETAAPSVALPLQTPPLVASDLAEAAASPLVTPAIPALPATGSGSVEERLERLLTTHTAILQQQSQALQALASTVSALQGAVGRMGAASGAGMPRAGLFVDAPNVVYAAENARVNIDYGRMLDFLGRGREMVHAIVYAPVTEDTGHRMENQRFVAPFLQKGYKLVTKPLKRFPDGTAKGNFDIELAIDIVTMSQRLDVVILISGDSDFSRLIELVQSRGVRVEVAAFASNVSWELVQMADVFIDMGQYLHEFRAL